LKQIRAVEELRSQFQFYRYIIWTWLVIASGASIRVNRWGSGQLGVAQPLLGDSAQVEKLLAQTDIILDPSITINNSDITGTYTSSSRGNGSGVAVGVGSMEYARPDGLGKQLAYKEAAIDAYIYTSISIVNYNIYMEPPRGHACMNGCTYSR
jgi:hypothetical protein